MLPSPAVQDGTDQAAEDWQRLLADTAHKLVQQCAVSKGKVKDGWPSVALCHECCTHARACIVLRFP
jgi:hypothetical protein